MTPPRPLRFARPGLAGCDGGVAGGAAVSGTWLARGSCSSSRAVEPDERRRRRRRAGPEARSGLALAAGGAATAGGSGTAAAPFERERRLRRRGAAAALGVPVSVARCGAGVAPRLTLAPTSPSAHMAPSTVWTSTLQTTTDDAAPPRGGRFWVSVQRA